ncbi:MAG: NAD-dependent epimerase/dehydratase family protein, partial [Polyangiales bacterium]
MPNPHTHSRTKPSARRGREPVRERPAARAPVARGVFGHSTQPSIQRAQPQLEPQVQPQPQAEPATGKRPKPATDGAVLVTGVCGRLGRLLVRELHRTDRVVGVDRRSFDDRPKDILHHQIDMRRKKMKDIFRGRDIRAVVHLGIL